MSICTRTTLNQHEAATDAGASALLQQLPRDETGATFAEPWQATAFALVVRLSGQGAFTWVEWTQVFGNELKVHAASGEPEDESTYYHCWMAALERLVVDKGLTDMRALLIYKDAWADAYRHTPHGKPVVLGSDLTCR